MNLFEFLMILLSLIVGFGLAEILSGVARLLKKDGVKGLSWIHSAISATIFIALLQAFWESWSLRGVEMWTFPAMLLLLSGPTLLLLIAHVLFPEPGEHSNLDDYYFERARLIWSLAGLTVIVGTLFRPLAFGESLWLADNLSGIPTLAMCILLGSIGTRTLHRVLVPVIFVIVILDTLTISYSIG
jgi:hypothetical protein